MPLSRFIEGPAGVGKTTAAIHHIRALLERGVASESILILVPHRALALPYETAFADAGWPEGAQVDILTLSTLAQRALAVFWPLVAERAGFGQPQREPTFLNIETAQYYMARFVREAVREGVFDSVNLSPFNIMRQTLNNLTRASVNGFALDEVAERLVAAWGGRHSSRPIVYRASVDLARRFRAHCLANNLVDYSLQIELLRDYLFDEPLFREYIVERTRHLVVDGLEESQAAVADFVQWAWDGLDSALLLFDADAGYRQFLGADPLSAYALKDWCETQEAWTEPHDPPPGMQALGGALAAPFALSAPPASNGHSAPEEVPEAPVSPLAGVPPDRFRVTAHSFYPQMVDWVVDEIAALLAAGAEPRDVVVFAPYLGDSLRFSLAARLEERGIPAVSHRPSRALRDEPSARALMTLAALAHPEWGYQPPAVDVADALQQAVAELDPVRAWLLTQIVYRPGSGELTTFDAIQPAAQERITFRAGAQYERLRRWLDAYAAGEHIPPDHFLSRLFGEVLSQSGFGLHSDLEAGRVIAELVQSARRFRQTLYPFGQNVGNWSDVTREYVELVRDGLLAGLYVSSWRDQQRNAVFLAPAHTYLLRNRWVDYQFWLDVGSSYWWDRLEQPLTHPNVLMRHYPARQVWTDEMEFAARQEQLRRLVLGLTRRCRQRVYFAVSNLGEQGYEQRGPLLRVVQQMLQRQAQDAPAGEEDQA